MSVELPLLLAPAELLGEALELEEAPPLADLSVVELGVELDEDDELGELGLVDMEPEAEPELDGLLLVPDEEVEPDGEDGVVAERLEDAPVVEPGPRSQPYRPLTARAIGTTTRAVFLSKLIR